MSSHPPTSERARRRRASAFTALLAALAGLAAQSATAARAPGAEPEPAEAAAEEPPPGVRQLLPRGALAAITEPRFVPAARAGIPDYAWVLGVVTDGEARAYDLNLLNSHEVVNDRIGERAFAAVW